VNYRKIPGKKSEHIGQKQHWRKGGGKRLILAITGAGRRNKNQIKMSNQKPNFGLMQTPVQNWVKYQQGMKNLYA